MGQRVLFDYLFFMRKSSFTVQFVNFASLLKVKVNVSGFIQHLYCRLTLTLRYGSHNFTCTLHHTCLYLVSVHQSAPLLIELADIVLQLTTH